MEKEEKGLTEFPLNGQAHILLGKQGVREKCFGFVQQHRLIDISGREVSNQQSFGLALYSHLSSLACGCVAGGLGACQMFVAEGGLVKQQVHSLQVFTQLGLV